MNTIDRRRFGPPALLFSMLGLLLLGFDPRLSVLGAEPPSAIKVNGSLTEVEGVRVLRVWGTPQERGYAHGALLAKDILALLDDFLTKGGVRGGPEAYERRILPMLGLMKIAPQSREELQGLLAGMQAVLGEDAEVPSLHRPPRYEDLVAVNCIPDFARMGCSSFAVWGPLAEGGGVLAGRNLDWNTIPPLQGTQIILVHQLDAKSRPLGWVSVTWPSVIGCLTGMNADGVTVSMHDVGAGPPSNKFGFTPRGLALREALEAAHGKTAAKDVARVLRLRRCAVGNNVPVTWPYFGRGSPSVVFEYDGDTAERKGLTLRRPDFGDSGQDAADEERPVGRSGKTRSHYQACTNHYRLRAAPLGCDRYDGIDRYLKRRSKEGRPLRLDEAWAVLREVALPRGDVKRIMTYHSVVFEPNQRRISVALSVDGRPAPACKAVTFDVAALLEAERAGTSIPRSAAPGGSPVDSGVKEAGQTGG